MEICLEEFAKAIPGWYENYKLSKYWHGYCELLDNLPAKAARYGHLGLEDLYAIAVWGGSQHGIKQRLKSHNTDWEVRAKTAEAIRYFEQPKWAIGAVLDLEHWGLTYASKTLLFMNPKSYVALDRWIRTGLEHVLPTIRDADRASTIRGYLAFLDICRELQANIQKIGPGPQGEWRLGDIQQAVFQFAQSGGVITGRKSVP